MKQMGVGWRELIAYQLLTEDELLVMVNIAMRERYQVVDLTTNIFPGR